MAFCENCGTKMTQEREHSGSEGDVLCRECRGKNTIVIQLEITLPLNGRSVEDMLFALETPMELQVVAQAHSTEAKSWRLE